MDQTTVADKPPSPTAPETPWWRRPWIVPLWAISVIFIVWRVPDYVGYEAPGALVQMRDYQHFLIVSGHIMLGSVALVCCCMQLWPWLRNTRPKVHRITGRVYVLVVIPSSLLALFTSFMSITTPPSGRFGNAILAVLWLTTTLIGFNHARKRRFADHRRWMIRSFALCFSIVVNRLWIGIYVGALSPWLDTFYKGDVDLMIADVAAASIWSSWISTLIFAEWWMTRRKKPRNRVTIAALSVASAIPVYRRKWGGGWWPPAREMTTCPTADDGGARSHRARAGRADVREA